jgi:hypothetical protein
MATTTTMTIITGQQRQVVGSITGELRNAFRGVYLGTIEVDELSRLQKDYCNPSFHPPPNADTRNVSPSATR